MLTLQLLYYAFSSHLATVEIPLKSGLLYQLLTKHDYSQLLAFSLKLVSRLHVVVDVVPTGVLYCTLEFGHCLTM